VVEEGAAVSGDVAAFDWRLKMVLSMALDDGGEGGRAEEVFNGGRR